MSKTVPSFGSLSLVVLVGIILLVLPLLSHLESNLGYVDLSRAVAGAESTVGRVIRYEPPLPAGSCLLDRSGRRFAKAVTRQPNSVSAHAGSGWVSIWQGAYSRGADEMTTAAQLSDQSFYAYLAGTASMYANQTDDALAWWIAADQSPGARLFLGQRVFLLGRWDYHPERWRDATHILAETIAETELPPETTAVFYDRLANMYDQMGASDRAIEAVQSALAMSPHDSNYRARLAWVLMNAGKSEEALREAQATLVVRADWRAHYVRGTTFLRQCLLDAAAMEFEAGLRLRYPGDYRYYSQMERLGDTYWEQGKSDAALAEWEQYLQHQPGSERVQKKILGASEGILPRECDER